MWLLVKLVCKTSVIKCTFEPCTLGNHFWTYLLSFDLWLIVGKLLVTCKEWLSTGFIVQEQGLINWPMLCDKFTEKKEEFRSTKSVIPTNSVSVRVNSTFVKWLIPVQDCLNDTNILVRLFKLKIMSHLSPKKCFWFFLSFFHYKSRSDIFYLRLEDYRHIQDGNVRQWEQD